MEEYFQKWCCLLLYAKDQLSCNIYSESLRDLKEKVNCNIHFYYNSALIPVQASAYALMDTTGENPEISNFFSKAFATGFRKVIMPLNGHLPSAELLKEGFAALKMIEYCIGPGSSGNIYLLGMNYFEPGIFASFNFNEAVRFKELAKTVGNLKLPVYKLPVQDDNITVKL